MSTQTVSGRYRVRPSAGGGGNWIGWAYHRERSFRHRVGLITIRHVNEPPTPGPQYQLIDFGDARKLESLGGYLVDRPSPAAAGFARRLPERWAEADARFDLQQHGWVFRRPWPEPLMIDCGKFSMLVAPRPFGHIGLFPEQAGNWRWLADCVAAGGRPFRALNLFAYTGASTLALAAAGARVTHVDAAKPSVQAARAAAEAAGWGEAPVRYLVDDARKFVQREQRRGRRYDLVALDPPAYGHGPQGDAWRLERDLWPLLTGCLNLLGGPRRHVLFTGHSPQVGPEELLGWLRSKGATVAAASAGGPASRRPKPTGPSPPEPGTAAEPTGGAIGASGAAAAEYKHGRLRLTDASGRRLDAGFFVRATW